jgi:antitoxin Phd
MTTWAFHEAKNKLSEVLDRAEAEGEQVITRHGRPAGAVISAAALEEFRKLREGRSLTAKDYLLMPTPTIDNLVDPADRKPLRRRKPIDFE